MLVCFSVLVGISAHSASAATAMPARSNAICWITIKQGDWLSKLTPNWQAVARANGITNPNRIYPGQHIDLCSTAGGASNGPPASVAAAPHINGAMSAYVSISPCRSANQWPSGAVSMWQVPTDCYANITWGGYGDCFGFVSRAVPNLYALAAHSYPIAGAVAHIGGGIQGASPEGHWALVLSVRDGWALIEEENNSWRGAGYNLLNYRYLKIVPGISYLY